MSIPIQLDELHSKTKVANFEAYLHKSMILFPQKFEKPKASPKRMFYAHKNLLEETQAGEYHTCAPPIVNLKCTSLFLFKPELLTFSSESQPNHHLSHLRPNLLSLSTSRLTGGGDSTVCNWDALETHSN